VLRKYYKPLPSLDINQKKCEDLTAARVKELLSDHILYHKNSLKNT